MKPPTLSEKIAEIRLELSYRRRVYPRMIQRGRMRPERATERLEILEAILADYESQLPEQKSLF